jgi:5'-nucleotidase
MIILIDIDEVLADFEAALTSEWQKLYPHTLLFPSGSRKHYYIGQDEEGNKSELVSKIIHREGFFEQLQPLPGAIDAIKLMQHYNHQIYLVTSAGVSYPNAASEKYRWVERHLGKEFLSCLVITPAKSIVRGDILIDDRPSFRDERLASWEHVLYDKSYNKTVPRKRRITWENWTDELPELLT